MLPSGRYEDLHILKGPYLMEEWDPVLLEVSLLPARRIPTRPLEGEKTERRQLERVHD